MSCNLRTRFKMGMNAVTRMVVPGVAGRVDVGSTIAFTFPFAWYRTSTAEETIPQKNSDAFSQPRITRGGKPGKIRRVLEGKNWHHPRFVRPSSPVACGIGYKGFIHVSCRRVLDVVYCEVCVKSFFTRRSEGGAGVWANVWWGHNRKINSGHVWTSTCQESNAQETHYTFWM